MSAQLDEILHHPTFQRLESAWRGLKFLVDRVDFRENTRIEFLNCSKDDLLADFEDTPEVPKSGLYKLVYSAEFGQFGGKPVAAILANYEFGPGPQDILLLQKAASVATMAHAPFFAAAGPRFFGLDTYLNLPNLKDIHALFEGPQYTKYSAFRDTEDARYVGLLLPRFLLRLPYGAGTVPVRSFNYEEDVVGKHDAYLWGNATFAFGTRLAESFARYRWLLNIIGPDARAAPSTTWCSTSTRRWATSRPRSPPRSCSPSAASTSSRRRASSASPTARTPTTPASSPPTRRSGPRPSASAKRAAPPS